jgi:hypothetical protein
MCLRKTPIFPPKIGKKISENRNHIYVDLNSTHRVIKETAFCSSLVVNQWGNQTFHFFITEIGLAKFSTGSTPPPL